MIDYQNAIEIIEQSCTPLSPIEIKITEALGLVVAKQVLSQSIVPLFNNSAMDGFAVKAADCQNISTILNVVGGSAAGDKADKGQGEAWEIMTGAPVPVTYDCVVKIEDVTIMACDDEGRPSEIQINIIPLVQQNIRDAGEDFKVGDVVINVGDVINPQHIMALATLGIGMVEVYLKPSVAIISTGKELVDDAAQELNSGQIRNSNAPYLLSALADANIIAKYAGIIHDEVKIFEEKIENLLQSKINMIISTGAVSMGRYDFIPDSLRKLGAEILFHKVAIRPGKPILFAKFPNGAFYFGLPGNPVSAAVGLRFFTAPLLRKLQNLTAETPLYAKLSATTKKKAGFRFFRKAFVDIDVVGQLKVHILQGQESFKIQPMLKANCWAILPENSDKIHADEIIEILPISLNSLNIGGRNAN